jgi:hypothetical protein
MVEPAWEVKTMSDQRLLHPKEECMERFLVNFPLGDD